MTVEEGILELLRVSEVHLSILTLPYICVFPHTVMTLVSLRRRRSGAPKSAAVSPTHPLMLDLWGSNRGNLIELVLGLLAPCKWRV